MALTEIARWISTDCIPGQTRPLRAWHHATGGCVKWYFDLFTLNRGQSCGVRYCGDVHSEKNNEVILKMYNARIHLNKWFRTGVRTKLLYLKSRKYENSKQPKGYYIVL